MIAGIFHEGSGLGNMLFRYVTTRVLATDKGFEFGMVNPEGFKGAGFMNLNMGKPVIGSFSVEAGTGRVIPENHGLKTFAEKAVVENGIDIRSYDPEINFVEDNTLIDGEFQDERYFGHRMFEISQWLHTEYLGMADDVCIIGFRGGEYTLFPELYLTKDYWETAINMMLKKNYNMKFVCVTDDPIAARAMLPDDVKVTHDISTDWRMIRYAKNLIIANSSFYVLPALLNRKAEEIIAPRYWARRNVGVWGCPQNYYRKFHYI